MSHYSRNNEKVGDDVAQHNECSHNSYLISNCVLLMSLFT